jgi:hypothetical protein
VQLLAEKSFEWQVDSSPVAISGLLHQPLGLRRGKELLLSQPELRRAGNAVGGLFEDMKHCTVLQKRPMEQRDEMIESW